MRQIILMMIFISLSAGLNAQKIADKPTYLKQNVVQMNMKWPRNKIINIVAHGHSVPAGFFKTPVVDTFNAYPHLLHIGLKKRFPFAVINVINTSIGGENSISGAKRFERDVIKYKPDIVTIDYALNDRGVGLAKAKVAWESMILMAKKNFIKVILLTPTGDKRAKMKDPKDKLSQHAEQIRQLAKIHNVALVDSYTAFNSYEGKLDDLMSQVNHPNRKGHDLVTDELLKWFP
jgi:acyl-CoA thioesterase-1